MNCIAILALRAFQPGISKRSSSNFRDLHELSTIEITSITGCLHFTAEPIQPRRPIYVLGRAYKLKHLYRDTFTAASLGDRPHYCYRQTPNMTNHY